MKKRFACPSCQKLLRNSSELREHVLQEQTLLDQIASKDFEYVMVKVPKAFLNNIRSYLARTEGFEGFNEFVLESLHQRMVDVI